MSQFCELAIQSEIVWEAILVLAGLTHMHLWSAAGSTWTGWCRLASAGTAFNCLTSSTLAEPVLMRWPTSESKCKPTRPLGI